MEARWPRSVESVYLRGERFVSYREGDLSRIIGLHMVVPATSRDSVARLCYQVQFADGEIDYIPTSEVEKGRYRMVLGEVEKFQIRALVSFDKDGDPPPAFDTDLGRQ